MIITKGQREIELMREAGRIVALVHKELKKAIGPGMTTDQINVICDQVIRQAGATPSFLNLYDFPKSVCTSVNDEVVHGIPGYRVLQEGDIISVDVGACYQGYHGDSAWTYAVGQVSDEAQKLMLITEESLYAGLAKAKPGNRLSDISHAIEIYLGSHGCSSPRDYAGHGIGSNVHEDPTIPNYGKAGKGPLLKKGMALAIEPMAYYGSCNTHVLKDGWTAVTDDHSLAAHYEHTVVIDDKGFEIMTKL